MFFIHILTTVLDFAGKGDRAIQFVEVTEREPWFVEGLRYTGEQIKGSCLVPKRAMDVMQCEVG
jgi:coronin-7